MDPGMDYTEMATRYDINRKGTRPLIEVKVNETIQSFLPEEIAGMIFAHMKTLAEKT